MRWMLAAVIAAGMGACAAAPAREPVVDGGINDEACVRDFGVAYCAPPGAACETPHEFCDEGAGLCTDRVCRAQCTEMTPRCATGEVEHHAPIGGRDSCVCVPLS